MVREPGVFKKPGGTVRTDQEQCLHGGKEGPGRRDGNVRQAGQLRNVDRQALLRGDLGQQGDKAIDRKGRFFDQVDIPRKKRFQMGGPKVLSDSLLPPETNAGQPASLKVLEGLSFRDPRLSGKGLHKAVASQCLEHFETARGRALMAFRERKGEQFHQDDASREGFADLPAGAEPYRAADEKSTGLLELIDRQLERVEDRRTFLYFIQPQWRGRRLDESMTLPLKSDKETVVIKGVIRPGKLLEKGGLANLAHPQDSDTRRITQRLLDQCFGMSRAVMGHNAIIERNYTMSILMYHFQNDRNAPQSGGSNQE